MNGSRTITQTAAPTASHGGLLTGEAMTGPEPRRHRCCIRCHKLIAEGETWRKVNAPDMSYAVAIHEACR